MLKRYQSFFAPHYTYEFLIEGVLKPKKYLKEIINYFKQKLDNNITIDELINIGKPYLIYFQYEAPDEHANQEAFLFGGAFDPKSNYIIIKCNKEIKPDKNLLLLQLNEIVGHELIHRLKNQKHKIDTIKDADEEFNIKKYLSDKDELMAFAWQVVEWYKIEGYNKTDIQDIVKNNAHRERAKTPLRIIYDTLKDEPKLLNTFYKYVYWYIEELDK